MERYYLKYPTTERGLYIEDSSEDSEKDNFAFIEKDGKVCVTDTFFFNTGLEAFIWMNSIIHAYPLSFLPDWSCSPFSVLVNSKEYVLLIPNRAIFDLEIDLEQIIVKAIECFENSRELRQIKQETVVCFVDDNEEHPLKFFNLFLNKFTGEQDLKSNDLKLFLCDIHNLETKFNPVYALNGIANFLRNLLKINDGKDLLELNLDSLTLMTKQHNSGVEIIVLLKELSTVEETIFNEENSFYVLNGKKNVEIIILEIKHNGNVVYDNKKSFLNNLYLEH